MVGALKFCFSTPGSSRGQAHCVVFLDWTLSEINAYLMVDFTCIKTLPTQSGGRSA